MSRATIVDVARAAGVSTMTVSRVVNGKGDVSPATRQRVQKIIERLDYRPSAVARSLSTNQTMTLGLVLPDITNPYFPEVARGAEDSAWREGYTLLLCNAVEDLEREERILRILDDKRVDGSVICSPRLPDEKLLPLLKRHSAVVLVHRVVPNENCDTVRVDDVYGAMRAVEHLHSAGRSSIACLSGPASSQSAARRLEGYERAVENAGRSVDRELIVACPPHEDGGYRAARELLSQRSDVDGLVCFNDLIAIGALRACNELSASVPDDVAIVGYDDIRMASLVTPALTTLRISKYDLGTSAIRLLLERIEGRSRPREIVQKPELVVRSSSS